MNYVMSEEEIEFNRSLDPRELLGRMGFPEDAIADDGRTIRIFCPIHKDQIIRSLIIEKHDNRFHCQYKSCPAHDGGRLIELFALYLGIEVPEAIRQLREDPHPECQLVESADRAIEVGNMEEATRLFEEAVRLAPRDEVTRCKLAAVYLETGQREKGFREYLTAAEDFAVKSQIDKTLSIYNILVMLSPQDTRVRRQMAILFSRLGRAKEASEHLKWVTDHLLGRGETNEAIKTVREILDLNPDEPSIHMLLARLLAQIHLISDAVNEAERTAEMALDAGDLRLAEEAITFGLIYRPQHEHLRELEARLRETPLPQQDDTEARAQEEEFSQWLGSLEEEMIVEPAGATDAAPVPATPTPPPTAGTSAVRRDKWLTFCRETLGDLDEEKLGSMGQHLRSMFEDVKASFQAGTLTEWELNILKDFYASFCRAYDEVRKGRPADGGGIAGPAI